jgi:hypothetical protein
MWHKTNVLRISCDYMDVDERKETTLINGGCVAKDIKIQDNYSSWIVEGAKSLMSTIFFCVLGVFCLFVGLLCLMFAFQLS